MAFSRYLDICIYPMLNSVSLYYLIFDSLFKLFKFICILRFVPVAYGGWLKMYLHIFTLCNIQFTHFFFLFSFLFLSFLIKETVHTRVLYCPYTHGHISWKLLFYSRHLGLNFSGPPIQFLFNWFLKELIEGALTTDCGRLFHGPTTPLAERVFP